MGFTGIFKRRPEGYQPIHRKWPRAARRGTWYLMPLELLGLIPALVIFGISQPDLYRTDMWQIGFDNKLNSNPNMILYAYANYRPLPNVPLVWSKTLTSFNVAISVISLFFLLTKLIAFIMRLWYPVASLVFNAALIALYAVSTYGQIGPDHADPRYPAYAAWYFRFGCDLAKPYGKLQECQIAQGSLAIVLYLLVIYLINLGFSAWAMWPNPDNDIVDDDEDPVEVKPNAKWEMQSMKSPMSAGMMPYTARSATFTPGSAPFTPGSATFTQRGAPYTPKSATFTPRSATFPHTQGQSMFTPGPSTFTPGSSTFTPGPSTLSPRAQAFHTPDRQLPLRQSSSYT